LVNALKTLFEQIEELGTSDDKLEQVQQLYYRFVNLLKLLIHDYGASISRNPDGVVTLGVDIESFELSGMLREFFRQILHMIPRRRDSEKADQIRCGIYRIHIGDVSRRIHQPDRAILLKIFIASRDDEFDLPKLAEHARDCHIILSDDDGIREFNVDVLLELPDDVATGERGDLKRILRLWEIFFQWLYKAWVGDGGASKK